MSARWWTLGVWALVAGSGLFWGLRLFVKAPAAPAHTQVAGAATAPRGDLTRLLGNDPPPPVAEAAPEAAADARFQLVGVLSAPPRQAGREGVALIAIDGQPPKAYRVGARIDGDKIVQSVEARGVNLGLRNGPVLVALNLPPPTPPATGSLPDLGNGAGARPGNLPPLPGQQRQPGQPMPAVEPQEMVEPQPNQADTQPQR
jgi:general secretion pathway protein C